MLVPTICEALGVAPLGTAEGASLMSWVRGEQPTQWREHVRYDMSWDDHLSSQIRAANPGAPTDHHFSVVRTASHRLVTFPTLPPMLFDLDDDPTETTTRAEDPHLAAELRELTGLIEGFETSH